MNQLGGGWECGGLDQKGISLDLTIAFFCPVSSTREQHFPHNLIIPSMINHHTHNFYILLRFLAFGCNEVIATITRDEGTETREQTAE